MEGICECVCLFPHSPCAFMCAFAAHKKYFMAMSSYSERVTHDDVHMCVCVCVCECMCSRSAVSGSITASQRSTTR